MVDVSLKELIEFGNFGPVRLGMSREEVESLLGPPDDWSVEERKHLRPVILKYGDVEFHFDPRDGRLWLIHLEEFGASSAGKSVRIEPWVIGPSLTVAEMEECLSREGVWYQVTDQADWDDLKCMVAGAGVKLIFNGERWRLSALSRCTIHAS